MNTKMNKEQLITLCTESGKNYADTLQFIEDSFKPILRGTRLDSASLLVDLINIGVLNKYATLRYSHIAGRVNEALGQLNKIYKPYISRIEAFIDGALESGPIISERARRIKLAKNDEELEVVELEEPSIYYYRFVVMLDSSIGILHPEIDRVVCFFLNDDRDVSFVAIIDECRKKTIYQIYETRDKVLSRRFSPEAYFLEMTQYAPQYIDDSKNNGVKIMLWSEEKKETINILNSMLFLRLPTDYSDKLDEIF